MDVRGPWTPGVRGSPTQKRSKPLYSTHNGHSLTRSPSFVPVGRRKQDGLHDAQDHNAPMKIPEDSTVDFNISGTAAVNDVIKIY